MKQAFAAGLFGLLVATLAPSSGALAQADGARREPLALGAVLPNLAGERPEACLEFNQDLVERDDVRYGDYLRIEPAETRPALRVAGKRLCLAGLAFGTIYQVTLRAGLPAASGDRLLVEETVPVDFGDRPADVRFADGGFILPRRSSAGIVVETVNLDRVKIDVLRVGDRGLAGELERAWRGRTIWSYDAQMLAASRGALIWSGEMTVERRQNQRVTTVFPLAQTIKERKPGAYAVIASTRRGGNDEYIASALQWVVDTDIALTTLNGGDGLTTVARSLDSGKPLAGIRLALIAVNNEVLGETTTSGDGVGRFAAGLLRGNGGMAAQLVMAYGPEQDFALLELNRPSFDLSDRGVGGRVTPGPVDAFLYTDRGIYRPGEVVQLVALARDRAADALAGAPVTLVLTRPNGVEHDRYTATAGPAGGLHWPITLNPNASRGLWKVEAFTDPTGAPVGRVEFDVQDFVPQRLKVTARSEAKSLVPGSEIAVDVEGIFLYGAPASGLAAEGEATVEFDPDPFPQWRGYRFGLTDETFGGKRIELVAAETDAQGRTRATGRLDDLPRLTRPLRAKIGVALLEPGGRASRDGLTLPVRAPGFAIGLKPRFEGGRIEEDSDAVFDAVMIDAAGAAIDRRDLAYTLIQEIRDYTWYLHQGQWRYQVQTRERLLAQGRVATDAARPAELRHRVGWGTYRLTLRDPTGGTATSLRFRAGWQRTADSADTPDKVEVSVDRASARVGETVRVNVRPPMAGELMIAIASDRVHEIRQLSVPKDGATIELTASADWGVGAYVLASFYRPLGTGRARDPVRAIGLAHVALDAGERTLSVALNAPERVLPRQTIELPVKVQGAKPGEPTFVTVAAVDEGILLLTQFASPQPDKHYFGKRRLGLDIRDDYGRLLDGSGGAIGQIREGGDSGGVGLPVVPTRSVALFSGFVAVDDKGEARVPLDIPDFTGQLRVMAVAHGRTTVGQGEGRIIVRDPVIGEIVLPRFLAPADRARLTLMLHNVEGVPGDYRVELFATGAVALDGPGRHSYALAADQRRIETHPILARTAGIGTIALRLSGPGGFEAARDWQIAVRSPHLPITLEQVGQQSAGESFRIDPRLLDAFEPQDLSIALNYSLTRGIDVPGLVQSLDRYPYGCSEQIASRALPLILSADPGLLGGSATADGAVRARVQQALNTLLERQGDDGMIGLWRAGDPWTDPWISAYALDVLMRAKKAGYAVPDRAIRSGEAWLARLAGDALRGPRNERPHRDQARAYAFQLLARSGGADIGQLRYFHDTVLESLTGALARAHLASALAAMGDRARAANALRAAVDAVEAPRAEGDYYASPTRDLAGTVAVAAEIDRARSLPPFLAQLQRRELRAERLNTQEKAWLLMAATAMAQGGRIELAVNQVSLAAQGEGPRTLRPTAEQVRAGFTVANSGQGEAWRVLAVHGTPRQAPPPLASGVALTKRLRAMADGRPVDPQRLRQNDRFVVQLSGKLEGSRERQMMLVDLLPAGWEIEGIVQGDEDGRSSYEWLGTLSQRRSREARDDRLVVAFNGGGEKTEFNVAYVVRAVTPGAFALPGASVEDMYDPGTQARTAAGRTTIATRP